MFKLEKEGMAFHKLPELRRVKENTWFVGRIAVGGESMESLGWGGKLEEFAGAGHL